MEEEFIEGVVELYNQGKWSDVLELYQHAEEVVRRKLLWACPSKFNIEFLKKKVTELGFKGITSVGCGHGLLEWILSNALGMTVTGIEVNKDWWQSRHSGPKFIDLEFPEIPLIENSLDPCSALLFCYFNDGAAFQNYANIFRGKVIIIIGPKEGVNRYTNPSPFNPLLNDEEWKLNGHQEVGKSGDSIAVYVRNNRELFKEKFNLVF